MEELNRQQTMPALALRGLTVFPQMLLHFDVGRQASIQALDESMASGQPIFLVAQRELAVESPQEKDLYSIGTICNVRQILRLPGDNVRVMVEGVSRGRLCLLPKTTPYLNAWWRSFRRNSRSAVPHERRPLSARPTSCSSGSSSWLPR